MGQVGFKDTGLDKVGGSVLFTPANSGSWLMLSGFTNRGEFTINSTDYVSYRESDASTLTFKSNELTAILPPRFTIQGLVLATDSATINSILLMGRTKGVKRMTGGLGVIDAIKDGTDTYNYIYVLIKNITFSEVVADDKAYVNFTIQVEQVN